MPIKTINDFLKLNFPKENISPRYNISDVYGASLVAKEYCGIKYFAKPINGEWEHGIAEPHRSLDPILLTSSKMGDRKFQYWVARKDQEVYLEQNGYSKVKAIGLPIVYVKQQKTRRYRNSLLVMPVHSLDYTSHQRDSENYAKFILNLQSEFSEIVICIHPSCIKHGYWIDSFKKYGFKIITGASTNDWSSLHKICLLMSSFEFMTTNGPGSHLGYGAYLGCKVSIAGDYVENKRQDYANTPFYQNNPKTLEANLESLSKNIYMKNHPEYFCHPKQAKQQIKLGKFLVGYENKISPEEMKKLFHWNLSSRFSFSISHLFIRTSKYLNSFLKKSYDKFSKIS
ncbi:hypothetical protein ACFL0S_04720 [Thermodesulfobacteriota bacterium]